jgi:protein TonB
MNLRKNPEKDLRKLSGLFFQIGLLSALLITVSAFEWKVREEQIDIVSCDFGLDDIEFVPPTVIEEKKEGL